VPWADQVEDRVVADRLARRVREILTGSDRIRFCPLRPPRPFPPRNGFTY